MGPKLKDQIPSINCERIFAINENGSRWIKRVSSCFQRNFQPQDAIRTEQKDDGSLLREKSVSGYPDITADSLTHPMAEREDILSFLRVSDHFTSGEVERGRQQNRNDGYCQER